MNVVEEVESGIYSCFVTCHERKWVMNKSC
jgi:hypothetical protein